MLVKYFGVLGKGRTQGIHIVSTTYGTWLPGDPSKRGHWSELYDLYGRVRKSGGRFHEPNEETFHFARDRMAGEAMELDERDRDIVVQSFRENITGWSCGGEIALKGEVEKSPTEVGAIYGEGLCGDLYPRCRVLALAVERTHFHLLIGPLQESVGRFVGRLKGRSASDVLERSCHVNRNKVWTKGYWKVFLYDDLGMEVVRAYIEEHNLRGGLGLNPYRDWVG